MIPAYSEKIKAFEWDISYLPHYPGSKKGFSYPSNGNCISSATKYPKEAWEFVKFFSGPKGRPSTAMVKNSLPPLKSAIKSPQFLKKPPESIDVLINTAFNKDCYYAEKHLIMSRFRSNVFGMEIQKFMLGEQDAETTLKNMVKKTQKLINEYTQK